MFIANIIALVLVLLGALNWGLVGIFNWNFVTAIFGEGSVMATIIYIIIMVAALWLIVDLCLERGKIYLRKNRE